MRPSANAASANVAPEGRRDPDHRGSLRRPVPKVLLGKRHHGHKFMPGKFVFPGGRFEPNDRLMPIATPSRSDNREVSDGGDEAPERAGRARELALAAIRETFEETGLILGAPLDGARAAPEGPGRISPSAGFYPDLSSLHFIARAVTPSRRPRRFDTRFFAVDASTIAHKVRQRGPSRGGARGTGLDAY